MNELGKIVARNLAKTKQGSTQENYYERMQKRSNELGKKVNR